VEYPVATDYFVLPKDHADYQELVELFGEKPKELRILIPVEDEETWAEQYYKYYSRTRGLICKGDGVNALRMVDVKTGELPTRDTETIRMTEITCRGKECPDYGRRGCGETMHLRFLIPEIPGLGIWQIDTGSINSILNINSCAKMIKKAFGRISLIPLKLTIEPVQVRNPEEGKVKEVHVLNLRTDVTLKQLAEVAREETKMLTVGDLEAAFDVEVEKEIDELWGAKPGDVVESTGEIIAPAKPKAAPSQKETTPAEDWDKMKREEDAAPSAPIQARDPESIKTINDLMKACHEDFNLQPKQVLAELNVNSQSEISMAPAECYQQIAGSYASKEGE